MTLSCVVPETLGPMSPRLRQPDSVHTSGSLEAGQGTPLYCVVPETLGPTSPSQDVNLS